MGGLELRLHFSGLDTGHPGPVDRRQGGPQIRSGESELQCTVKIIVRGVSKGNPKRTKTFRRVQTNENSLDVHGLPLCTETCLRRK